MDTAQEVLAIADFAFDQGDVVFAGQVVDVAVDLEFAELRRHLGDGFADDVFVVAAAVVLEVVDGDEFQAVFIGDFPEVRRAHHRAVIGHDFTAQADLFEPCQAHEVDRGFCVAIAGQDASAFGDEREVVARTAEIFGTSRFFDTFAGRQGAFDSGNARRRVDVVDGNGEGCFMVVCIFTDHLGQAEFMGIFDAHRHADQALAVAGHKVHVFRRAVLGGADEVAFVFPVFVIDDDDDFSLTEILDGFFYCIQYFFVFHGLFYFLFLCAKRANIPEIFSLIFLNFTTYQSTSSSPESFVALYVR